MKNEKQNLTLCLHAGGAECDRKQLAKVQTPEGTHTWRPGAHIDLVKGVEEQLVAGGFRITDEIFATAREGARFFGLMQVAQKRKDNTEYSWVLGMRNSHDKSFPRGIAAGSRVFACDNLAFSSEIRLDRRNTVNVERDMPGIISSAIGKLADKWNDLDARIAAYKDRPLTDQEAHDLLVKSLDARAVGIQSLKGVLKEYRKPSHECFEPRTAWSLFNAFTEVMKKDSVFVIGDRTSRLHGVFDSACGLALTNN